MTETCYLSNSKIYMLDEERLIGLHLLTVARPGQCGLV